MRPGHPVAGRAVLWAVLAAAAAAILPFLPSVNDYFLSDDFGLIWLFSRKDAAHFLTLFTSPWTEFIYGYRADELRPTVGFSYWLDAQFGAADPRPYHLDSILLHAADSLLVLTLARRLLRLPWTAAAAGGVGFALMAVHVETVVWISGRADSIPALFMLLTLLGYGEWRSTGRRAWYAVSVAACGLALFSKQSAVVLPVLLACYDLLLRDDRPRPVRRLGPLLPFVLLTAAYLALRLALFGNAVREDSLNGGMVGSFLARQTIYLTMLVTGAERFLPAADVFLVAGGLVALAAGLAASRPKVKEGMRMALYFGPAWWLLTVGPLAVVGYVSARHLYLASAGVALLLAAAGAAAFRSPDRLPRQLAGLGASGLIAGSLLALHWQTGEWNAAARQSQRITVAAHQALAAQPEGALTVIAAPPTGPNPALWTWLWAFATPFALEPPFAPGGPPTRGHFLTLPENTCCPARWYADTRRTIEAWSAGRGDRIEVLGWTADGRMLRVDGTANPEVAAAIDTMRRAGDAAAMNRALQGAVRALGPGQAAYRHR